MTKRPKDTFRQFGLAAWLDEDVSDNKGGGIKRKEALFLAGCVFAFYAMAYLRFTVIAEESTRRQGPATITNTLHP